MKVRELMTPEVACIECSASVIDAYNEMEKYEIGSLLVLDKGKPIGIVTAFDILGKVIAEGKGVDTCVEAIMTLDPITISSDEDIRKAAKIMFENKIWRLPVVKNKKAVGVISATDIIRALWELK